MLHFVCHTLQLSVSLVLCYVFGSNARILATALSLSNMQGPGRICSASETAEEYYARIFYDNDSEKKQPRDLDEDSQYSFKLEQDSWQEARLRSRGSPFREVSEWYLKAWRMSGIEEDIGNWGVSYRTYVEEYVRDFASLIDINEKDDRQRTIFESAVGSGWLIRGLMEVKSTCNSVQWYGNDILPDALRLARRDIPGGNFVLADSTNLTWIPSETFDDCICGYLEASSDVLDASGYPPNDKRNWFGNWVYQMARLVRPGGQICVGAIMIEHIEPEWWIEAAKSDDYDWCVDPKSIKILHLDSDILKDKWGNRYCVRLCKKG